jgi:ubiquinone/menaquinone biosynthesis C-methylase UbiE
MIHPHVAANHDLIVRTYTSAADRFDSLPFWHHFGRRTIDRLPLFAGARVLDLCCGSGASAMPAAERVGPTGTVIGVDITPALVAKAQACAAARNLTQVRFDTADVATLEFPAGSFDAVVSVFGIFFLDDMPALVRRAWSWLAPGGALATTVWGRVVLAPGEAYFWEAVRREDPTLDHVSPADRLAEPEALARLHAEAGVPAPDVFVERWRMPLTAPDDFWPVILGTSNRGACDALAPEARARVKRSVLSRLEHERVDALEMEALIAVVRKAPFALPGGSSRIG